MDFNGKVVLVTGGAGAIGKAIARTFLENGAKVSICDINEAAGKSVLEELEKDFEKENIIFSKCDVSKEEDFEGAYKECESSLGVIDILINNAGKLVNDYKRSIEVNLYGTIIGTEIAMKKMGKHNKGKGGFVVNIASVAGVIITYPMYPFYASSKAGIVHYSRILGASYHYDYSGVSILCLCPGATNTPMIDRDSSIKEAYNKCTEERMMINRKESIKTLKPKEIGDAVIKMIKENRTGKVAMIDSKKGFIYIPPSLEAKN